MPKHIQIRIKPKPVKPRMSQVQRDPALEAANRFVAAMQYYWLFGQSDARASRCDATGDLLIDAIAIDQRVLRIAANPPMDFEVEQVHLRWSFAGLQKMSEQEWQVSFGSLPQPVGFWTDAVDRFDPKTDDELLFLPDVHGYGSPFRVRKAGSALRPEQLPYVPVHEIKGLKPVRFSLWRWCLASHALARFVDEWRELALGMVPDRGPQYPLAVIGTALDRHVREWQVRVAREVATALKHDVLVLPQFWHLLEETPRGVWEGDYTEVFRARPGDQPIAEIDSPSEMAMVRDLLHVLGGSPETGVQDRRDT